MNRSSLLTSKWVITLTGTLIGAFLALYLNEWMANRKLRDQKQIATQNILAEIASNDSTLSNTLERHRELFAVMTFLGKYLDAEGALITYPDTLREFEAKFPHLFSLDDSVAQGGGLYEYDGEVNIDLSFPQFEFSTIAWETLRSSGISATYDFECLLYLEKLNKVTQAVIDQNIELIQSVVAMGGYIASEDEEMMEHLNLLLEYETTLAEMYEARHQKLKGCE